MTDLQVAVVDRFHCTANALLSIYNDEPQCCRTSAAVPVCQCSVLMSMLILTRSCPSWAEAAHQVGGKRILPTRADCNPKCLNETPLVSSAVTLCIIHSLNCLWTIHAPHSVSYCCFSCNNSRPAYPVPHVSVGLRMTFPCTHAG